MGLDLYHLHASDTPTELHSIIDPQSPELVNRRSFFRRKTNEYIDFETIFTQRSLAYEEHVLVLREVQIGTTSERVENYYFCRKEKPDVHNVDVFTTNKKSFFPARIERYRNRHRQAQSFKLKQFPLRNQDDDVIYLTEVGYQRKGVADAFYEIFPPDLLTADVSIVAAIHRLTAPELQTSFAAQFMDNWDEDRSVLLISW